MLFGCKMLKEDLFVEGITVKTKKPHPCGCFNWRVVRLGADIKLQCVKCKHYVFLSHDAYIKSVKAIIDSEIEK